MRNSVITLSIAAAATLAGCSQTEVTRSDEIESRETGAEVEEAPQPGEADENLAVIERGIRDNYAARNFEIVDIEMTANEDRTVYTGHADVIDPDSGEQVRAECTVAADANGEPELQCSDPRPEFAGQ